MKCGNMLRMSRFVLCLLVLLEGGLWAQTGGLAGRVNTGQSGAAAPHPVRNDAARAGQEIVTLRYFKIKKGAFDQFLKASEEGVWPYFEKIGSRVVGMWQAIQAEGVDGAPKLSPDFDEVYLMTRYASLEHWASTRDAVRAWVAMDRTGKMPASAGGSQ